MSSMAIDPITDYSKTQRIVLLVDLNPLLRLPNPTPYITAITSAAEVLLSFPPFSSSTLFSFRLFFSSLSPLLSSSRIHSLIPSSPLSLSFDHPTSTFNSLSNALNSLSNLYYQLPLCEASESMHPRASCFAASMRQLLHDYAWDPVMADSEFGTPSESFNCVGVRTNLVVLFSPFSELLECWSGFLGVDTDDECVRNLNSFSRRFCGLFESVNDAFSRRDIQFSWINVSYEASENKIENDELKVKFEFLESGIRNLGWGLCSTDSIVLGSALLPFGLIYPKIGMTLGNLDIDKFQKKNQAQLRLEILDKGGKPLECKFCELELIDWKILPENRSDDSLPVPGALKMRTDGFEHRKTSWELLGDATAKLHVKAVRSYSELLRYKGHLSGPFLVRELSETSAKDIEESNGRFFADEVLEMLALELGDCKKPKSIPIFQILLSFLYKEGYWALVSISNANGDSHLGILKPFMVSSALLFVIDNEFYPLVLEPAIEDRHLEELGTEKDSNTCKLGGDSNKSRNSVDCEASPSVRSQDGGGKRKEKKTRHLIQNFTWTDFYKAAFEHLKIELEDAYFDRYCNSSKKLKFFKCWEKQIKKSALCGLMLPEKLRLQQDVLVKKDDRLTQLHQESEEPATSSGKENSLAEAPKTLAEATIHYRSETSEDFFNNLSDKIQQGLKSEAVDLGALAERLVCSAIYWLGQKHEVQGVPDDQPNTGKSDSTNSCTVAAELNKLLLREPKDLATKPKINNLSFEECSPGSTGLASENIVREHELQIFFRMEILRSAMRCSISESMKQKFVKHICLLLETIQCHLEGGFFGEWSLENYVGRIIKSRYCQTLEDVVNKVYEKLDLFLFADENESPNHLLYSEDSNHSWRGNTGDGEVGDNYSSNDPVSAENKPLHEHASERSQGIKKNDYTCKLIKAQERREKARRFASFTSWVPDFQRVWAPKQRKARKPKANHHLGKGSKRKYQSRESNDMVCETPLTEKKQSFKRGRRVGDEDAVNKGDRSCRSVSKALFKDMD